MPSKNTLFGWFHQCSSGWHSSVPSGEPEKKKITFSFHIDKCIHLDWSSICKCICDARNTWPPMPCFHSQSGKESIAGRSTLSMQNSMMNMSSSAARRLSWDICAVVHEKFMITCTSSQHNQGQGQLPIPPLPGLCCLCSLLRVKSGNAKHVVHRHLCTRAFLSQSGSVQERLIKERWLAKTGVICRDLLLQNTQWTIKGKECISRGWWRKFNPKAPLERLNWMWWQVMFGKVFVLIHWQPWRCWNRWKS